MPKRAAPGDRAAIEAALTPTLRAALDELRELFDIENWQATQLAPVFQTAAALRRAAVLVRERDMDPDDAVEEAAKEFGLRPYTIHSRCDRWPTDSRQGTHYACCAGELVDAMVSAQADDPPPEATE